ncbi:MAG: hypothetical protein WD768_00205 [Phycisphaeraceae bacterium]
MHDLRERWNRLWESIEAHASPESWFDRLGALYTEPHRAYHNADHLSACFDEFERSEYLAKQPFAVEWALWFHDAVYDPQQEGNEGKSAALALEALRDAKTKAIDPDRVRDLVMATRHDIAHTQGDEALICDIDLAILGQKKSVYDTYESTIRKEYAFVEEETYARERTNVLQSFLARPHLYATAMFRGRYEAPARANLERAIRQLRHEGAPA